MSPLDLKLNHQPNILVAHVEIGGHQFTIHIDTRSYTLHPPVDIIYVIYENGSKEYSHRYLHKDGICRGSTINELNQQTGRYRNFNEVQEALLKFQETNNEQHHHLQQRL